MYDMQSPIIHDARTSSRAQLMADTGATRVIDSYAEQLEELFLIRNPRFKFDPNYRDELDAFTREHCAGGSLEQAGTWVFFPWSGAIVHYLPDDMHQELRTARNKNLITAEEQKKFYDCRVGIAGLSVGSHGAVTIALMGGCRTMKLADPDTLSGSNLNRMRFDFTHVGRKKAELIAEYVWQLNPYADIRLYTDGITDDNLSDFLDGLDVVIEELDDIEVKVRIREEARARHLPVVMVTDNGDNTIVDLERFDLHPEMPVFHGRLEGFDLASIKESRDKLHEAMARIIDLTHVPTRVMHSVLEVGKTLYSWPQLGTAATMSGTVLAYIVRKLAVGEPVTEGKSAINLDPALDPDYEQNERIREEALQKFLVSLG